MIGYLKGELLEHDEGKMLIGIGSLSVTTSVSDEKDQNPSGSMVGYCVAVPQSVLYRRYGIGQWIELFVHTHVREDVFDLYGFGTKVEKILFLTLLTVNGIGPKSALGILSATEPQMLIDSIIQEDQVALSRIPGIGKKTAERIVLELKDSLKKKVEIGFFANDFKLAFSSSDSPDNPLKGDSTSTTGSLKTSSILKSIHDAKEAKEALLNLGYREGEIQPLLHRMITRPEGAPHSTEEFIRTALKQLV